MYRFSRTKRGITENLGVKEDSIDTLYCTIYYCSDGLESTALLSIEPSKTYSRNRRE